jgi:hypothetical protein
MQLSSYVRQVESLISALLLNYAFMSPDALSKDLKAYSALSKCGVAVVLPKEMKGFRLDGIETKLCKKVGRCGSSTNCPGSEFRGDGSAVSYYIARYVGPGLCKIRVEGEVGRALGEGDPNRTWSTQTDLFGSVVLRDWPDGALGTAFLPVIDTPSLWNRQYRSRFPTVQYFTSFSCSVRQFNPALALEIIRSLHVVHAD